MKAFIALLLARYRYYPFGMLMPGRQMNQGVNIPGATVTGNTVVNGYTVPVDLTVNSRTGTLQSEYVASANVEFSGEFESTVSDEFVAYISDAGYAGTGNLGAGLSGSGGSYRYGFNGKENDNEIKGLGNQQDYGMRIYDTRLGKFLSVDPLAIKYPWYTPYQFAGNKPIWAVDLDGAEELPYMDKLESKNTSEHISNFLYNSLVSTYNGVAGTWNGTVKYSKVAYKGGLPAAINQANDDFKPIQQGFKDMSAKDFANPDNYWSAGEDFTGFLIARQVVKKPANQNPLVKVATSESVTAQNALKQEMTSSMTNGEALAAKYKKNRPSQRQTSINKTWETAQKNSLDGNVYDPNTGELLNWDKFQKRQGQWDMGHKPEYKYSKEIDRLG